LKFYSLKNKGERVDFKRSVIKGLAPDGGLYFPVSIPSLDPEFIHEIAHLENEEIAFQVLAPFVHENIPFRELNKIIRETLNFSIPVVEISENIHALELYHGPTLAFKDVGARFMSRCLGYFVKKGKEVVVLVATSGDTGSAVANGFLGVEGVKVVVLYPHGKVSSVQEKQFASLGQNISSIAIEGTFDDCQALVKQAFQDKELNKQINLSSANSINTARWLPQSIYYFLAYKQLAQFKRPISFSVPSGNLGNVTAGVLAMKMGLPISKFVIASNANKVIPDFIQTGEYLARKSVQTIANAMDVGDPSNFTRLLALFQNDYDSILQKIISISYSDDQIRQTITDCHEQYGYLLDPHGATGYLSLKELLPNELGVFLETAHPAKFGESIRPLGIEVPIPASLQKFLKREVNSQKQSNSFPEFKNYLLANHG
jgi:threonine synthase